MGSGLDIRIRIRIRIFIYPFHTNILYNCVNISLLYEYECICIDVGGHTIEVDTQYTMLYVIAPNRGLSDLYA